MKLIALIALITMLAGCGSQPQQTPLDLGTQQNVDNALMLAPGMSMPQVVSTMGARPVKVEFAGKIEEWHYCATGFDTPDEFVAVFFYDSQLIAMKPYSVTYEDAGALGSCELFVKMGNYREPKVVTEYRVKYR